MLSEEVPVPPATTAFVAAESGMHEEDDDDDEEEGRVCCEGMEAVDAQDDGGGSEGRGSNFATNANRPKECNTGTNAAYFAHARTNCTAAVFRRCEIVGTTNVQLLRLLRMSLLAPVASGGSSPPPPPRHCGCWCAAWQKQGDQFLRP